MKWREQLSGYSISLGVHLFGSSTVIQIVTYLSVERRIPVFLIVRFCHVRFVDVEKFVIELFVIENENSEVAACL